MKTTSISRIAAALAAVTLSGCVSWVDVRQAKNDDSDGLHYYLPQTFIVLTPNPDGTMNVETKYIPDPDRRYTIKTHSFVGNYTIDVNRSEEGFLETVIFGSDATGVAKQAIQTAGTLRATEIEANATKAKAAADAAKAAADKSAADIAAADKARAEAQVALDVADAKLRKLREIAGPNPPAEIQAQIVLAELARVEASARRDAAIVAYSTTASNAAANAAAADKQLKMPEPVFYRVEMGKEKVALRQEFSQQDRVTWNVQKEDAVQGELRVLPNELVVRPDKDTGGLTGMVKADRLLNAASFVAARTLPAGTPMSDKVFVSPDGGDRTTVLLQIPQSFPSGDYEIDTIMTPAVPAGAKPVPRSFIIRVERPKK